ncbi:MAG: hypothetical protein KGL67_02875 [Patescibacteria group bacterium]|nr:hypothetical protein [Patescibacteria group bacterium]
MKNKTRFVSTSVKVTCLCHPQVTHETATRRNKNLIRLLESFVILPVLAVSMPFGVSMGVAKTDANISPQIILSQQHAIDTDMPVFKQAADNKAKLLKEEAKAIDSYFAAHSMPLKGMGNKMAEEADKNNLDYRLIPAIAVRESTGGKHACGNNPFGWDSCKTTFKSKDEAVEVLARNLSGNNPNTAKHYGGSKTTKQILQKYNPPSIVRNYAAEVMGIMDAIGDKDLGTTTTGTTANS